MVEYIDDKSTTITILQMSRKQAYWNKKYFITMEEYLYISSISQK